MTLATVVPGVRDPRAGELLTMLTYRRPAGSDSEAAFIARFIAPLGTLPDEYGNHWITVGSASPILWSCHTDTVHKAPGSQRVIYGGGQASAEGSNCLGADCTTGVWLMANMIRARVPGTYIFHRAEEIGGLGSSYVADACADRLQGLQYAIAFDRRGYRDIVTHQLGERCASEAFATSLATALHPLPYTSDDGGTFTDTANYAGIIPECCNISVGYHSAHSATEWQDVPFALRLLDRLLSADLSRLACQRDPAEWGTSAGAEWWERDSPDPSDLAAYARAYPRDVAGFLESLGYTLQDVENWVFDGEPAAAVAGDADRWGET